MLWRVQKVQHGSGYKGGPGVTAGSNGGEAGREGRESQGRETLKYFSEEIGGTLHLRHESIIIHVRFHT